MLPWSFGNKLEEAVKILQADPDLGAVRDHDLSHGLSMAVLTTEVYSVVVFMAVAKGKTGRLKAQIIHQALRDGEARLFWAEVQAALSFCYNCN